MSVSLKRMYNAKILSLNCLLKKNSFENGMLPVVCFLCFELRFHVGNEVRFAQISRNILTFIPRKDTHPSYPLYPSENLTTQSNLCHA